MIDRFNKWYDSLQPNRRLAVCLVLLVVAIYVSYIGFVGMIAPLLVLGGVLFTILIFVGGSRALKALRRKL